jgi:outer membrane protein assembly factor BamB
MGSSRSSILRLLATAAVLLVALAAYLGSTQHGRVLLVRLLADESVVRDYGVPVLTEWQPNGVRRFSSNTDVNARPATFGGALHTDTHGSDEVATVIAPMFEAAWTAETNMFVAEGPVFDSAGNVYFSPLFAPEDVIVVSLDPETGKRRWVLEGSSAGAGTPLVIEDQDSGQDRVYAVTYDRAVALDTAGNILWDVSAGQAGGDVYDPGRHCFGSNYHIATDSIVAVMGDGHVYVLDRLTGASRLVEHFVMPGAPTPVTNFSLPEDISRDANRDIAHMYPPGTAAMDPIGKVLHGAAGELQKVTNFFSIDSNSGRIWIAATLPDEADGKVDGWADFAALYGLDLLPDGEFYRLEVAVVSEVPGGTASTPTVSADGKRIYIADAFDTVYAVDADSGEKIWSFNVGAKVTGSLNVAADNGEIYANTRTEIKKLIDRGDNAELVWAAKLDMYTTGRFQSNFKSLGAEIGANGLAFTGAVGIVAGKQKFPFKVGAGLIDRETGEIRYFADGAEDSVSSMVTGPDGGLYVGNSPLRRVLGRATFGEGVSPQPVVGGVTRFKPIRQDLIIRDALWAASTRARNAAGFAASHPAAAAADLFQIRQLIDQCRQVAPQALGERSLQAQQWSVIETALNQAEQLLLPEAEALQAAATILDQALLQLQSA